MSALLWTGGFDSTYRLLELIAIRAPLPRIIYVLDQGRLSIGREIDTMMRIRRQLGEKLGVDLGKLEFIEKDDIRLDPGMRRRYESITSTNHLGTQYLWLASLAMQLEEKLELCIEKTTKPSSFFKDNLYGCLRENENGILAFDPKFRDRDIALFQHFLFPVITLTKQDMLAKATSAGLRDYLLLSHFCLTPRPSGKPCGWCNPCHDALAEGMAFRIPPVTRLKMLYRQGVASRSGSH